MVTPSTGAARRWSVRRAAALLVVAVVAGCSSSGTTTATTAASTAGAERTGAGGAAPSSTTSGPASTPAGLSAAEAATLIDAFDPGAAGSASRLADLRGDPAVVTVAGDRLRAGATGRAAWAAVYVWANEGDDVALLRSHLADADVGVRLMAATGVAMRGDVAGFGPLVALLTSDEMATGWIPPGPAWLTATTALVRATADATLGPPADATPEQRALAQQRWTAWLARDPRWNDTEQRWFAA